MAPTTAARRAILALRETVKRKAATANLYQYGARSPEVVQAWKDRQTDLSAIEFYQQELERAKQIQREKSSH